MIIYVMPGKKSNNALTSIGLTAAIIGLALIYSGLTIFASPHMTACLQTAFACLEYLPQPLAVLVGILVLAAGASAISHSLGRSSLTVGLLPSLAVAILSSFAGEYVAVRFLLSGAASIAAIFGLPLVLNISIGLSLIGKKEWVRSMLTVTGYPSNIGKIILVLGTASSLVFPFIFI